jgi:hypothetical protein
MPWSAPTCLARASLASSPVPRGDGGAGQRRGLGVAQAVGQLDDAGLVADEALGQRPAALRAQRAGNIGGLRAPALPVGEEQRGDAVADLQAAHVLADRDDLASAVRAGHEAVGDRAEVGVLTDQQVAEVE